MPFEWTNIMARLLLRLLSPTFFTLVLLLRSQDGLASPRNGSCESLFVSLQSSHLSLSSHRLIDANDAASREIGLRSDDIDTAVEVGQIGLKPLFQIQKRFEFHEYRTIEGVPYKLYDRTMTDLRDHFPIEMLDLNQFYGKTLLDIGSGPNAAFVSDLREMTGDRVTAIAVDLNANYMKSSTLKTNTLVTGSASQLPFKSESFDFIYSSYSIFYGVYFEGHSKKFLRATLAECRRVLKPNGVIRFSPIHDDFHERIGALEGLQVHREGIHKGHLWIELTRVESQ
jgi:SAM-dependent methyltransferase